MNLERGVCPFCGSYHYFVSDNKYTCFSCFATGENINEVLTGKIQESDKIPILEDACKIFQKNILSHMEYAKARGIDKKIIQDFRLGYADGRLYFALRNKYSDEELEKVGLIKLYNEKYRDSFYNRLIFPFINSKGNVRAANIDGYTTSITSADASTLEKVTGNKLKLDQTTGRAS